MALEDVNGNIIETGTTIKNTTETASKDDSNVIVAKSTNPKTGDNIMFYVIMAIIYAFMIIIFSKNKTPVKLNKRNNSKRAKHGKHSLNQFKFFSLFLVLAILIPTNAKAGGDFFKGIFNTNIKIMDKLIVAYEIDGNITEKIVNYNEIVESIEVPAKTGYKFDGWYLNDGTKFDLNSTIIEDTSLKAKYNAINYSITYSANGGDGEDLTVQYTYNLNDTVPSNTFTREGYTFKEWNESADGTGTSALPGDNILNKTSIDEENITYYAIWIPNTYIISYNANNNDATGEMREQTAVYDETTSLATNTFEVSGYAFCGWDTLQNGNGIRYEDNADVVNLVSRGVFNLYAQWAVTPYTITFDKNNEDATGTMENMTVPYGETVTLTENNYQKDKYKVRGWNTKADGTGIHYDDKAEIKNLDIDGEITLYAEWSEISATFANGSTVNKKLKQLVSPNAMTSSFDRTVTSIKRFTGNVDESQFTSANIISDSSSNDPIYAWYDQESTTIYWWTIDTNPKLNEDASMMFYRFSSATEIDISTIKTDNTTNINSMFFGCSKVTELDLTRFNTSNVTDMEGLFGLCTNLREIDLSSFDTHNVTSMRWMFFSCEKISTIDVSGFDTSNVTDMSSMFAYTYSLNGINVSTLKTSNVTNMAGMFSNSGIRSLDLSKFNTCQVNSMESMFSGNVYLKNLNLSSFDTSEVTNMSYMFNGCNNLTELKISNFNTNKVKNMKYMFNGCESLTELKIDNFDTSKVTDMNYMFSRCNKLTELDLSNFETNEVRDMSYMFDSCGSLTKLNINSFNTSKVVNMSYMFKGCSHLTELNVSRFNTSNVTNMVYMFNGCSKLTELNINNFNTAKVTNMAYMFNGCSQMTKINMNNFNTSAVINMNYMFKDCENLTELNISSFNTKNVTHMNYMFENCTDLEKIYVSDLFITQKLYYSSGMFKKCTSLVGGAGTTYDLNNIDKTYAHIDEGIDNPGYLTNIDDKP